MTDACKGVWKLVRHFALHIFRRVDLSERLAVMLMETFDRLSRKDKYVWDVSTVLFEDTTLRVRYLICFQMYGHVGFRITCICLC